MDILNLAIRIRPQHYESCYIDLSGNDFISPLRISNKTLSFPVIFDMMKKNYGG